MNSIGIMIPSGTQMSEVKLRGKLDLSMWRGGGDDDDDEDKDSSIDFSLSPTSLPPVIINNSCNVNSIKDISANFVQQQPQPPTSFSSLGLLSLSVASGSTALSPAEKSYLRSPSAASFASSGATDHDGSFLLLEEERPEVQLTESHKSQRKYSNKQFKNGFNRAVVYDTIAVEGPQIGLKNIASATKGGAKKVEFVEERVKSGMGVEESLSVSKEKARRPESSGTGSVKRPSRSQSGGFLLNEIRKMSLASQDAEEEKKKLAASGQQPITSAPANKGSRRFRRKKRREEEYTDKDRAAAVTLGSKDIKQSLKAKKKRERKMHLSIDLLNSEEYLSSMLVVEASYQLRVKKQPTAALATLNKALELQPTHKGALVARSQCHLRLGDASSALKDAQTSFDQNETFIQGLFQYAEALFELGEFEKALISYHQGYRLRKDMEGFRIGVQKSQEAIRRAIGDRSATKMGNLDDILSIIEELQESKRKAASTCKDEDLLMNILKRRFGEKVVSGMKSKPKNKWITREVLGQMYMDKNYLAKFIHRPDVKKQIGNANALRDNAKEGLKYLESREEFWRQQNPLYSRKNVTHMINSNSILSKISTSSTPETPKSKGISPKPIRGISNHIMMDLITKSALKATRDVDSNNNPRRGSVSQLQVSLNSNSISSSSGRNKLLT